MFKFHGISQVRVCEYGKNLKFPSYIESTIWFYTLIV